jgi:hypothetical protein
MIPGILFNSPANVEDSSENSMIRSMSSAIILLTIIFLAISGCIVPQQVPDSTSNQTGTTDISPVKASLPIPTTSAPMLAANYTVSPSAGRPLLNVLRGEPFIINGTVNNLSITKVQIWLFNGNISTTIVPVLPDGTFQVILDPQTIDTLSKNYTTALVVQYPGPPDNFSVVLNRTGGAITEAKTGQTTPILSHVRDTGTYPTTQVDYLEQGISAAGDSDVILFFTIVDAWITIDPISPAAPGSLTVHGNTSLPEGTSLSIDVMTDSPHPTPKDYDFSHEQADGNAVVRSGAGGSGGIHQYTGNVDTSRLNTGKYSIYVSSEGTLQANAEGGVDIITGTPAQPEQGNYIDWARLALPPLAVNKSLTPVMLPGEWKVVPPGNQTTINEVPYGSIIDCTPDGICRVYDSSGEQFFAVYNSNEARIMEVPSGAMVDGGTVGNVTFIKLDDTIILTKIDENPS